MADYFYNVLFTRNRFKRKRKWVTEFLHSTSAGTKPESRKPPRLRFIYNRERVYITQKIALTTPAKKPKF